MRENWHVPRISAYNAPGPAALLHVVFLQRMSEDEQNTVVESLKQTDDGWAKEQHPEPPPKRKLSVVPWIRDYWPSSSAILDIAWQALNVSRSYHNAEEGYRGFIFVDSGWDAGNVIAAQWKTPDEGGEPHLDAVRVPFSIAERLLTLVNGAKVANLQDALGEQYDEAKIDFYKDIEKPEPEASEPRKYQPPFLLPDDLSPSTSKPLLLSIRHLAEDELRDLLRDLHQSGLSDSKHRRGNKQHLQNLVIHNWPDPDSFIDRADLFRFMNQVYGNPPVDTSEAPAKVDVKEDKKGHFFLIDNIVQGEHGEPQIMAASIGCTMGESGGNKYLELLPVETKKFMSAFDEASNGDQSVWESDDVINIFRKEYIFDPDKPMDLGNVEGAGVFFLSPFTLDEQRSIRTALSGLSDIEVDTDFANEYTYHGYLWPTDSAPNSNAEHGHHTVQDLLDLFQVSHPSSPFFDPKSHLRLTSYPGHCIVVDNRCLDEEDPKVLLVSDRDFTHFHSGMNASDEQGWLCGAVEPSEAHINWVNLDIANMAVEECAEEVEKLYMNDLKQWAAEEAEREDD